MSFILFVNILLYEEDCQAISTESFQKQLSVVGNVNICLCGVVYFKSQLVSQKSFDGKEYIATFRLYCDFSILQMLLNVKHNLNSLCQLILDSVIRNVMNVILLKLQEYDILNTSYCHK